MKSQTLTTLTAMLLAMALTTTGFSQQAELLKRHPDRFQHFAETEYSESLGVVVEVQRAYGGPYANLKIVSLDQDSVAATWGFERGDVLIGLNGQLTGSAAALDQAFNEAGNSMQVTYINVRNGNQETTFVRKPFPPPPPPKPLVDEDPIARSLGLTIKKIWDDQMVVFDPGFGMGKAMGLRTGDVIKGFAAVGIPVYSGQPPQDGAILRQLRVFRFGTGEFTIDVSEFGTVIFQP